MQLTHSKAKVVSLLLFIFLLLFSQTSLAQESSDAPPQDKLETHASIDEELDALIAMEPEELLTVVVASKRKESWKKAPGVVTVVTKKDIKSYGANNLHDVLNRLPNIYAFGNTTFRDNVVSIRGQSFTNTDNHVLILLNGRPVRESHVGGVNMPVYRGIPLESIERIEVIRGPGSVLYGTNAFSGVINIVTLNPKDMPQNEITGGWGSDNTGLVSGNYSNKWKDISFLLSGRYFDSDGWGFHAVDGTGKADSADFAEKTHGVFAQANYKELQFMGFTGNITDTNIRSGPRFPSFDGGTEARRDFSDVQWEHEWNPNWNSKLNFTYNGFYLQNHAQTNSPEFEYDDYIFEPSVTGHILENINLQAGGIYQRINGTLNSGATNYSNDRFNFYMQMDYSPWDFLKLIGGFQVNKPEGVDFNVSPRFGAIANINKHLGVKLLFGQAFRSAFAAEQAINISTLKGNPKLNPETIETFDAQIFYTSAKFYTALTYYQSNQQDTVVRVRGSGGITGFFNSGEIDYEGIEWEGKIQLPMNLEFTGSLTYQTNEDADRVQDVGLIPNLMAKQGMSYLSEGYSLGLFHSYFGDAARFQDIPEINPPAEAYHLLTFKGSMELNPWLPTTSPDMSANLFIDNLLDEDINFVAITSRTTNTLPLHRGLSLFGTLTIKY
jgi:outer membrane receptor for ferrienterochelin and colicins